MNINSFSIIGSGNMAYFLATHLQNSKFSLNGVWARDKTKASVLAKKFDAQTYSDIISIPDNISHICFIAVADQAVAEITSNLKFNNTLLVHTSGSLPLQEINKANKHTAVLWPIYSILKNKVDEYNTSIPIAVNANSDHSKQKIIDVANAISSKVIYLTDEQRLPMHLSSVICNNFCNHLFSIVQNICNEQNIPFNFLLPIIFQTFERLQNNVNAKDLQTGPSKRNDTITIDKHLNFLEQQPFWQELYQSFNRSIRNMYKED